MRFLLFAIVLVLSDVFANANTVGMYVRYSPPPHWSQVSVAPPSTVVTFHIGLRQTNLSELNRRFLAVSDPTSDEYQNFMSINDIAALIAPLPEHKRTVLEWLTVTHKHSADIVDYSDAIEVTTTAAVVSDLFHTDFFVSEHDTTAQRVVAALGVISVPVSVMAAVSIITGITSFPPPHLSAHISTPPSFPYDYHATIPQTVWNVYGIPSLSAGTGRTTQGVIEFEAQYSNFRNADLLQFGLYTGVTTTNVTDDHIIGPNDQTVFPGGESSLDIQWIAGVNPTATNYFWLESGSKWLYEFGVHFFNTTDVPMISSISYAWWELDQCSVANGTCQVLNVTSMEYAEAVDILFQKIQLRGLTIVVGSGDAGTHTRMDPTCTNPRLLSDYPASSPYVTSVGTTMLVGATQFPSWQAPICTPDSTSNQEAVDGCISNGYEVTVDVTQAGFTSGGGFSDIFPMPKYQQNVVQAYLNNTVTALPPFSMFNSKGRGRPDVAALGHNGFIYVYEFTALADGTSMSSPIFAAIAALLNDEMLKITNKPLGFLNPFLYQMYEDDPTTFNDIILGDNICSENGCTPTCEGFMASYGWDAATGLGTPNYPKMLAYVRKMGARVLARRQRNKSVMETQAE